MPTNSGSTLSRPRVTGFHIAIFLIIVIGFALPWLAPAIHLNVREPRVDMARAYISPNGPLSQAIDLFHFNTHQWPRTLDDLIQKPSTSAVAETWKGPYIQEDYLIDPWGHAYKYRAGKDATHHLNAYDLWSIGPDGLSETADDVTNWQAIQRH